MNVYVILMRDSDGCTFTADTIHSIHADQTKAELEVLDLEEKQEMNEFGRVSDYLVESFELKE